jgi:hypothetical protein
LHRRDQRRPQPYQQDIRFCALCKLRTAEFLKSWHSFEKRGIPIGGLPPPRWVLLALSGRDPVARQYPLLLQSGHKKLVPGHIRFLPVF